MRAEVLPMSDNIEVRVHGRGVVHGERAVEDTSVDAVCMECDVEKEAVASIGTEGYYLCADCLRARLDALSVARFLLRPGDRPSAGLPWGKISG
jgi:hypothetical protein